MSTCELENLEWDSLVESVQDGLLKAFPYTRFSDLACVPHHKITITRPEIDNKKVTMRFDFHPNQRVALPVYASYPVHTDGFYMKRPEGETLHLENAKRLLEMFGAKTNTTLFNLAAAKIIEHSPEIRTKLHVLYFKLHVIESLMVTPVTLQVGSRIYYCYTNDFEDVKNLAMYAVSKNQCDHIRIDGLDMRPSKRVALDSKENQDAFWRDFEAKKQWHFRLGTDHFRSLVLTLLPARVLTFVAHETIREFLSPSAVKTPERPRVLPDMCPARYKVSDTNPQKRVKLN